MPLARSEEPSTPKLEESKRLGLEDEDHDSSEAEWVAEEVDEQPSSPSP